MSRRTIHQGSLALAVASLVACGEVSTDGAAPVESRVIPPTAALDADGATLIGVSDFVATYDAVTGDLNFEMLPPTPPELGVRTGELATVPQAL